MEIFDLFSIFVFYFSILEFSEKFSNTKKKN